MSEEQEVAGNQISMYPEGKAADLGLETTLEKSYCLVS